MVAALDPIHARAPGVREPVNRLADKKLIPFHITGNRFRAIGSTASTRPLVVEACTAQLLGCGGDVAAAPDAEFAVGKELPLREKCFGESGRVRQPDKE